MEIKDLKVGMKFIEWSLGFNTWDTTEALPEELRPFYKVIIIEKVNKVSFIASGMKYTEIPDDWTILSRAKSIVVMKAKLYLSHVDDLGRPYCTYYKREYSKYLKTLEEAERTEIMDNIIFRINARLDISRKKIEEKSRDRIKLELGLREPRWDER